MKDISDEKGWEKATLNAQQKLIGKEQHGTKAL